MFLPLDAFSAENKGVLYQSRGMVKHCFGGKLNSLWRTSGARLLVAPLLGLNRPVSNHAAKFGAQPFDLRQFLSDALEQS